MSALAGLLRDLEIGKVTLHFFEAACVYSRLTPGRRQIPTQALQLLDPGLGLRMCVIEPVEEGRPCLSFRDRDL